MDNLEQKAIDYFNKNKKQFFEEYTKDIKALEEKTAIFTAGMSGVGKTEFCIFFKENNSDFIHIDTDDIREFFRPIGYDGQNSDTFQKVASRGFNELFNYSLKQGYSIILDSNFASKTQATQNIERLLKRGYSIEIYYLYNEPKVCFEYATRREIVTHRKVPKEVFVKSNTNSYNTVLQIKSFFKNAVHLHFIDKKEDVFYQNIDANFLKNIIGGYFENWWTIYEKCNPTD